MSQMFKITPKTPAQQTLFDWIVDHWQDLTVWEHTQWKDDNPEMMVQPFQLTDKTLVMNADWWKFFKEECERYAEMAFSESESKAMPYAAYVKVQAMTERLIASVEIIEENVDEQHSN